MYFSAVVGIYYELNILLLFHQKKLLLPYINVNGCKLHHLTLDLTLFHEYLIIVFMNFNILNFNDKIKKIYQYLDQMNQPL